jgi:hypothetical protein
VETITNVFNYIFLHTKNIDITFYHSQKSFYYYVEFIEQITEDKNMFLKLSSRDAAMYVYKKTIFEINNESRKHVSEMDTGTVDKLYKINEYINLIKSIVYNVINNTTFYLLDKIQMNKILLTIENICNRLMKISDLSISEISLFSILIEKLNIEDIHIDKYVTLLELSIKKIEKGGYNIDSLREKIMDNKNYINLKNNCLPHEKVISTIFCKTSQTKPAN